MSQVVDRSICGRRLQRERVSTRNVRPRSLAEIFGLTKVPATDDNLDCRFIRVAAASVAVLYFGSTAYASPQENIERVIQNVEIFTGEKIENRYPGKEPEGSKYCQTKGFCAAFIGELRIEAIGRMIEINPSPRVPPEMLINSCRGLLAAFTEGRAGEDVKVIVNRGLAHALEGNVFTAEFEEFRYEMKLNLEQLPACSLVRYVPQ